MAFIKGRKESGRPTSPAQILLKKWVIWKYLNYSLDTYFKIILHALLPVLLTMTIYIKKNKKQKVNCSLKKSLCHFCHKKTREKNNHQKMTICKILAIKYD